MTDVPPESRPVPPPAPDPAATHVLPPDQTPPPPRQRLVDRLWSFRALIAVALASVILGGLAGAALANVGDGDDRRGPMRFQRGGPMGPGGQQWRWGDGPRNGPGQGRGIEPMPRLPGPQQDGGNGLLPPNSAPTPSPLPNP